MTEYEKEWFEKDYYAILGVTEIASSKDIKKEYRKLARELHPDANPGDARAEERFKEVSAAYDVIGDEDKRVRYDKVRKMGPIGGMYGGAAGPGAGGFNVGFNDCWRSSRWSVQSGRPRAGSGRSRSGSSGQRSRGGSLTGLRRRGQRSRNRHQSYQ